MKIRITGDYRDVADSAWISTSSEARAKSRSDDDAKRVVNFLIKNHHSSPLESVSLTMEFEDASSIIKAYWDNKYSRSKGLLCSIDLLNFMKVTYRESLFDQEPWLEFVKLRPELSEMCLNFSPLGGKNLTSEVDSRLGKHDMDVELVSHHNEGSLELSRATWRIRCPLSIAVQILRHRSGSFNQTSGRYRTLKLDLVPAVKDCDDIFSKIGEDLNRFLGAADGVILRYNEIMKKAKDKKGLGIISNEEYKRLREFARFILPEGRMTELYVTFYLDDFYNNYVVLRDSDHAQVEHIWIAKEMQRVLERA